MKIIKSSCKLKADILVDDEDYEWLSKFEWYVVSNKPPQRNCIKFNRRTTCFIHRDIVKACIFDIVDHIDRNILNNQKSNLRFVSKSQNCFNSKKRNGECRFKGITKVKNKYRAIIFHERVKYHLGYYQQDFHAALAYNKAVRILSNNTALLNNLDNEPINSLFIPFIDERVKKALCAILQPGE